MVTTVALVRGRLRIMLPSESPPPHLTPFIQATMNALVEGAGGDLRLILGQLQMVRRSKTTLSFDDVKGKQVGGVQAGEGETSRNVGGGKDEGWRGRSSVVVPTSPPSLISPPPGTSKDADLSPFEVSRRLFEPNMAQATVSERLDLVFADADLVPLLIQV